MRLALACCLLAACTNNDPPDFTATLHISGAAIDRIIIYRVQPGGNVAIGSPGLPTAPVTPEMIAANQAPPASADVETRIVRNERVGSGPFDLTYPTQSVLLGDITFVGMKNDAIVGSTRMTLTETQLKDAPGYRTDIPVALDPSSQPELFGPMIDPMYLDAPPFPGCVRLDTFYIVDAADFDCDGVPNTTDCTPSTYCADTTCTCP